MAHMKPQIEYGDYYEIETSVGTEIVPADVCSGETAQHFQQYLEGRPLALDEEPARKTGWLARLSAPGYMDCTDWSAHETEQDAQEFLADCYDEERETPEDTPTVQNCDDAGTGEGAHHGRM